MKCPKCGYLGFEHVDRCRNCGYEFALAPPASDPLELPLRSGVETAPLEDLAFLDQASASASTDLSPSSTPESLRAFAPEHADAPSGELPLFGIPLPDDAPLINKPSAPRPPLAVRRATPEVPRLRSMHGRPAPATLELDLEPSERPAVARTRVQPEPAEAVPPTSDGEDASIAARLIAVLTDLAILAGVDLAVVYFTLQVCGIGLEDLGELPIAPLVAFMLVQNGGYLVAFTASGQTLGKMMAGIRVVSAEPRTPLDLGRAFVRELMWLLLAVPAGLGLLTVLSRDRRGVHDRFAGTRVVRASFS
jgi:uncharacterized RDD family membrane protein YckC